jgi:HD-GYP domain-containing protein (c-di-GMP phosphodiesterase class II)
MNKELLEQIEEIKKEFNSLMDKVSKNIKRQEKIMQRADKRQQKEYDELQRRLEEVKKLEEAQKNLLESFIKILAEAIDAKSPYTGMHCERVPEIVEMMVDKFGEKYNIDENTKKSLHMASWLHDCGKVVTPEYVMDKSVKLETIYNRIHEIRTRFEVIYRDLEIEALKRELKGEDKEEIEKWLNEEKRKLKEDFEFIASANIGKEFMKEEDIKRIKEIANREWFRHFDDKLGVSYEELSNYSKEKFEEKLPVKEKLLSDKPYHLIKKKNKEYDGYGFKIEMPKYYNNKGEIYNLCIKKGTLNKEEFFKIQEHIMMTIVMLESLPFPDYLKNVPLYAGAHHEKLNGNGYPRKLKKEEIPIPARMIAIADIFEALTSADRPYKEPKTLSQALKIMAFMAKDNEIDAELFEDFIKSKIYLEYAKKNLKPFQIDEVDEDMILSIAKGE